MKLCRFDDDRLGLVQGESVRDVTAALTVLPGVRWPLPQHDPLVACLGSLRPAIEAEAVHAPVLPLAGHMLRSPIASPGKILAVRENYGDAQGAAPDFFLKATSSVAGPGSGIVLPASGRACRVEIELAAIIGSPGREIPRDLALAHIAGYCIALDVSLSGDEDRGLRKSPDTFCVLGPWLTTADEIPDFGSLHIELEVNGCVVQEGCTSQMRHDIASLVAAASTWFALRPGDVVLTGAPAGSSLLTPGDLLDCRIDRLGAMRVAVSQAG
jgi:2-keto-4-pentenoate hydratase/2-oxohepta-3-ene-1,7-dioic acid hydratase in catechol pathway